jgi:putative nucleotidyltransferase with HDIG domain
MDDLLRLAARAEKENIPWAGIQAALASHVAAMEKTPQPELYHGEGDVWTHTKMVCENLVAQKEFENLPQETRTAVFLAALLHDIAKPVTTRWEDGRWRAPNHAPTGARMARELLWDSLSGSPEKQQLRETVCLLIRYHSTPPHAVDDPYGSRKLRAIAENGALCPMFSLRLLCLLSRADALGRVSVDQEAMLEQVQLCQEFASECGCLDGPYPFPSAYTKYAYLSGRDVPPEVPLYDDTWGQVILLSGLPGTGKDTWIRENCPDLPMISLDEIRKELGISPKENQGRVAEEAQARAKQLLRQKKPFVWNATNITPSTRQKLVGLFADYGAAVQILYLETHSAQRRQRNLSRPQPVPEQVVARMLSQLTPPEAKEAHSVCWETV